VSRCNRAKRRTSFIKHSLLLIDSTTITVGGNRLPWSLYHGQRSGIKLHVAYTPSTGMPLEVKETTGLVHDGPVGVSLADTDYVIVEDRAYGKHEQLDAYQENHQGFVIRLRDKIKCHHSHSLRREKPTDSPVVGDSTCQIGTKKARTKHRFRVISFVDREGHIMRVVTNLLDVSAEKIAEMYKERWAIESFFQWIKGYLNTPVLFGNSQNAVFSQLFVGLIAYVLLKWTFDHLKKKVTGSLSFQSFCRCFLYQTLPIQWENAQAEFFYRLKDRASLGIPIFGRLVQWLEEERHFFAINILR